MKLKTLQTILWHSNIGIKMNLYVHTTGEQKMRSKKKLKELRRLSRWFRKIGT